MINYDLKCLFAIPFISIMVCKMHSTTVQLHKNAHCNIHCLIYETKKPLSQVQIGLRGWGKTRNDF